MYLLIEVMWISCSYDIKDRDEPIMLLFKELLPPNKIYGHQS